MNILKYILCMMVVLLPTLVLAVDKNASLRLDDETITALVVQKLTRDPILRQYTFRVNTQDGRVTLFAELTTDEQYANAVMLAGSVKDVISVDASGVTISHARGRQEDVALSARIKANLMQSGVFAGDHIAWPIHIELEEGSVYVTGRVNSNEDKAKVLQVIQSTEGVLSVDEDIEIGFDD
ncbi:MAG: BON domain-containing protein [Gammaproteobacteria bacterium]